MLTPRIVVNLVVALAIALFIGSAHAFMIGLDGSASNGSDALYALNRHGREVKIAQTGTVGPDWVVLEDLGLQRCPPMAPFCLARRESGIIRYDGRSSRHNPIRAHS